MDEEDPQPVTEEVAPQPVIEEEAAPQPVTGEEAAPQPVTEEVAPQPVTEEEAAPQPVTGEEAAPQPVTEEEAAPLPTAVTPPKEPSVRSQSQHEAKLVEVMSDVNEIAAGIHTIKGPPTDMIRGSDQLLEQAQKYSDNPNMDSTGKHSNNGTNNLLQPFQGEAQKLYRPSMERSLPPPKTYLTKEDSEILRLKPRCVDDNSIFDQVDELTGSIEQLARNLGKSGKLGDNFDKITKMSQVLTTEANALRKSIKCLSEHIAHASDKGKTDVNFPYHLFLIEMVVNKIHMKCDCFTLDDNNLVISATFLGKQPIILYDSSYGKIENFNKVNAGKSTLFAMTYDKICAIEEFEIYLQLTKEPPCSSCVTKIADTRMDYTTEFLALREELCKKWKEEKPKDNIICTTSTPLSKSMFYLSCGENCNPESIGIIEVSVRMSFLGKEINTAFCANPKPRGTSTLMKDDNGMTMYACQKVEMDDQGKILLDEEELIKKNRPPSYRRSLTRRTESPISQIYSKQYLDSHQSHHVSYPDTRAGLGEFRIRDLNDEINKLMREKRHWEVQIKLLGGPDHARVGPKMLDQDGKEVPGNRGYKYFGAAKDLPGVRELFEQEPPPPPRRTRADLMRDVDADYYGYRDDDDGLLIPLEQEAEKEAIARAVAEWKANKEQNKDQDLPEEENIYPEDPDDKRIEDEDGEPAPVMTSHVAVPSQKDIEEALLRRKKHELLERYGCLDVKIEG